MTACAHPVPLEQLAAYERGELTLSESEAIEDHVFGCDACAARLEALARLVAGVRDVVERGQVPLVLTRALEDHLVARGVRTRVFRLARSATVPCAAAPDDDLLILHLEADLAEATHLSLAVDDEAGALSWRHDDLPVEADDDTVRVAFPGDVVRGLPDAVVHLRLSIERDGAPPAAEEYTLVHAHAPPA